MNLGKVDEYVVGETWQIFKPHGSVNWGRWASWDERMSDPDQIRRWVIDHSADLEARRLASDCAGFLWRATTPLSGTGGTGAL